MADKYYDFNIKIADLGVRLLCDHPYTKRLCKDFIIAEKDADITVGVSAFDIEAERRKGSAHTAELSDAYFESIAIHRAIAEALPPFDGFVFHGAAVEINGGGHIFAARSGTGKTTHVSLLLDSYPQNVRIINGDKPIIRKSGGVWRVFSSPWAGKEGMRTNSSAPLRSIVLLERATDNFIEEISAKDCFNALFGQIYLPDTASARILTLELADSMAKCVSFYRLGCNISKGAAQTSYNMLK